MPTASTGPPSASDDREADNSENPGRATADHGHHLFGSCGNEGLIDEMGRQHADKVSEKQEQHAHMEQVAAPAQVARAQQLG